ncbi:MAG TPA: Flp pilus assembly protein CpaB [Desulfuromonadales bacterium]|nr:Flp pilus assembly protein CpaB [Desulfuromonadales bacterium]
MKKYTTFIVLILAVGLGMAAVFLVNKWLAARASQSAVLVQESMPLTKVVIAAVDMTPGTRLTEANLTLTDWPKATVPKGAFESIDALKDRIAVSRVPAGSPLLAAELAAPGSGAGLVAIIAPGMRAMTIRVDEVIGVGGFILPNTFVDVIGVQQIGNDPNAKKAETLLKKIKVLAVAQETHNEDGKAKLVRTVTMELLSKEAEKLALQVNLGPIHLVLRNPLEDEEPVPAPAKVAAKRPAPARVVAPRVVTPPTPKFKVEVIQGDKKPEAYEFSMR